MIYVSRADRGLKQLPRGGKDRGSAPAGHLFVNRKYQFHPGGFARLLGPVSDMVVRASKNTLHLFK